MRFINVKRNPINLKIVIAILLVVVIIVVGVVIAGSISNGKNSNNNIKNSEKKVDDKKDNETTEEEKEEEQEEKSLLNTELKLSDICKNKAGICSATVGEFTLGGSVHTLKINIDMADVYNSKLYEKYNKSEENVLNDSNSNAIYIDSKKIPIKPFQALDKIIKIGEDNFAIGVDLYNSSNYKIMVYDKDINFVKNYSSLHVPKQPVKEDEEEKVEYLDYFKVENNTFTRYTCDTSKDTGDGNNQILNIYKIIVIDGTLNEQKISSVDAYCSTKK